MKKNKNNIFPKNRLLFFLTALLAVFLINNVAECRADQAGLKANSIVETPPIIETQNTMEPKVMENNEPIALKLLIGKVTPAYDLRFVAVERKYADRAGMFMYREAYEAFKLMHAAAAADGIHLFIVSAFRTFNHQRRIWNNKWNGRQPLEGGISATIISDPVERALEILRYSAMPGTSRHHWGTDIDINSVETSYFESLQGKRVYEWLSQNAGKFGFCQPYTPHGVNRNGGHEEEMWHWSYRPVSERYLKAYLQSVDYGNIKGFDGWETASGIGVIGQFVNGVNGECK